MKNPKAVVSSETVTINAPAAVVWQVLTDLPSYPQWNPFTVKVESDLTLGNPVDLYLPKPGKSGELMKQSEFVGTYEPEKSLAWGMTMKHRWVLQARRDQLIEAIDEKSCRYVTTDSFKGLLANTVIKKQGDWIKQGFDSVAFALKARAESLA